MGGMLARKVGWLDTNECDLTALGWLAARQTFQIMNGGPRGVPGFEPPALQTSQETRRRRSVISRGVFHNPHREKEAGFGPEAGH